MSSFIVIEGPNGTGKTTHSKRLVDELNYKNIPAKYLFDPGVEKDNPAMTIREIARQAQVSTKTELLLLFFLFLPS